MVVRLQPFSLFAAINSVQKHKMTFMQYRKKPARHPWQVLLSDRRCVGVNKAPSLLIINTLQPSFRAKVHYRNHPSALCNYIFAAWQFFELKIEPLSLVICQFARSAKYLLFSRRTCSNPMRRTYMPKVVRSTLRISSGSMRCR